MKKFTAKEIAEYLMNENSFEWEYGEAYYYLYYTDGKLGGNVRHHDFWTKVRARYIEKFYDECLEEAKKEYYGEDYEKVMEDGDDYWENESDKEYDERYVVDMALGKLEGPWGMWDKEDLDNPDFMEVAQEMADELNEYIEEEEEEEC